MEELRSATPHITPTNKLPHHFDSIASVGYLKIAAFPTVQLHPKGFKGELYTLTGAPI
jgi:hypothetical protein